MNVRPFLAALSASLLGAALLAQEAKPSETPKTPHKSPEAAVKPKTEPVAVLETTAGKIVIRFFPEKAPNHVKNFLALCKSGFYNGTKFHRVIPGFVIQGGDPNTKKDDTSLWGTGGNVGPDGKEKTLKAEFNDVHHGRGIVSMARAADPDSASSQFFICVGDAGALDRKYTAFGQVIEGMDVVDKIVSAPTVGGPSDPEGSRPRNPVTLTKARVEQRPVEAPAAPAP